MTILERVKETILKRSSVFEIEDIKQLVALAEKSKALAEKLDEITSHMSYKAVFDCALMHGLKYYGPNFNDELIAVRKSLNKLKEEE